MWREPLPVVSIVDDDASVRRALTRLLRSVGLEARAFASAEAFVQAGLPPPDTRNPPVRRTWRRDPSLRCRGAGGSLPVILITAHDDVQVRARARSAGVVAYLRKPFEDEPCWRRFNAPAGTLPEARHDGVRLSTARQETEINGVPLRTFGRGVCERMSAVQCRRRNDMSMRACLSDEQAEYTRGCRRTTYWTKVLCTLA
jgi:CheY-like chemotaxis protein